MNAIGGTARFLVRLATLLPAFYRQRGSGAATASPSHLRRLVETGNATL